MRGVPRAGAAAGLLLAAALLLLPGPAEGLRDAATDALMRAMPRPAAERGAPPVLIVAAGEADLAALGPWPWPRARWAALVQLLAEAGAAATSRCRASSASRRRRASAARCWGGRC